MHNPPHNNPFIIIMTTAGAASQIKQPRKKQKKNNGPIMTRSSLFCFFRDSKRSIIQMATAVEGRPPLSTSVRRHTCIKHRFKGSKTRPRTPRTEAHTNHKHLLCSTRRIPAMRPRSSSKCTAEAYSCSMVSSESGAPL